MDEDDDGGLGFDFGIDDEGLDSAIAVFEGDVFVMTRRGIEAGFGPVLRLDGRDREREKHGSDGEFEDTRHRERHGEEFSH